MDEWEYLRVAVHYRDNGNIDFVSRQERGLTSEGTHEAMRGDFNVEPAKWDEYLQKLKDDRWQLDQVEKKPDGQNETYYFKRVKE